MAKSLDSLASLPAIQDWVNLSAPVLDRISDGDDRSCHAIKENVLLQLEHLMEHPYIAKAVADGKLKLHDWVYHFENGQVEFLNPNDGVV